MTSTSPGWYDDGHGAIRWWDGAQWTEHVGAGGHPAAGDRPFSAVPATRERRASNLWIVWVVLGVIVLGVVIAASVLIPRLWTGLASGSGSSATPTAADQQAAVDAVQRHNDAWMTGDCDDYMSTTTVELRAAIEITSCEKFAVESRVFSNGINDYVTSVGDVETVGTAVAVSVTESYTTHFDEDGNETDEPVQYEDDYEYILVRSGDGWSIDEFYLE